MGKRSTKSCRKCERLQQRGQTLEELVAAPAEKIRPLEEKLAAPGQNPSSPPKPPSSDIVKPPKPEPPPGQDKRHIGAQPGHPKHERAPFTPEQINGGIHLHTIDCCP